MLTNVHAKIFLLLLPNRKIIRILNIKAILNDYSKNEYVGNIVWGTYDRLERMPQSYFQKKIKTTFENNEYNIPYNYHSILTNLYGDYMKLPPREKRVTHHKFSAFWK